MVPAVITSVVHGTIPPRLSIKLNKNNYNKIILLEKDLQWSFVRVRPAADVTVCCSIGSSNTSLTESHPLIKLVLLKEKWSPGASPYAPLPPSTYSECSASLFLCVSLLHYRKFSEGLVSHTHTKCNLLSITEKCFTI